MDFLFQLFQGSYTYLLIIQLLVVAGLFFTLLWLMVQRMRESRERVAIPPPTMSVDVSQWENKIAALQKETADLRMVRDEANGLREKVRYLESKLMEYEILQEEIGSISDLKMQNEQLRRDLVHAQAPKEPVAILFDATSKKVDSTPQDPTQAGLDKLLQKIDELTKK